MKTFKDLESNNPVFIVSFNRDSQIVSYRKAIFCSKISGEYGKDNCKIFFQEDNEIPVVVDQDKSLKVKIISGSSKIAYFSDIESLEKFLKDEIEGLCNYRNRIESINSEAWRSIEESQEIKEKEDSQIHLIDEPQKYPTLRRFSKGDIIYNSYLDELCIYDGGNKLYDSDGYDTDADALMGNKLELALQDSKKEFLCKCRETILNNKSIESERMIEILKVCGYKWEKSISDILHESN